MITFMFCGVECRFSEKAEAIVPSEEDKTFLLETFFSNQPINSIEWVDWKALALASVNDGVLPIYTIGNDTNTLLFWPATNGVDLVLGIESAEERPDLPQWVD